MSLRCIAKGTSACECGRPTNAVADTSHPPSSGMIALAQVKSYFMFIASIRDEALRSCLTCCGNTDMNAHVIHRSGSGSPTKPTSTCCTVVILRWRPCKNKYIYGFNMHLKSVTT